MSLKLPPLLSALQRNPTGAVLIALQIGITLAVLTNAAALVSHAIKAMNRPTGFDTRDTFVIALEASSKPFNVESAEREDLGYLRNLPGVAAATVTFGVPLTEDGGSIAMSRTPDTQTASITGNVLTVDQQGLQALDVPLIAGRNFRSDEIAVQSPGHPSLSAPEVVVTRSLAHVLFPHKSALGQTIYLNGGDTPSTVIGITRDFMGPQVGGRPYDSILIPDVETEYGGYVLLVRARPGKRDAVLREAKRHIGAAHSNAVIFASPTLEKARRRMYAGLRNTAIFLTFLTLVMLALCCLGIFGLGTFNVGSRTKQIGVRRALGARKRDIVVLFLAENALTVAAGSLFGCVLAFGIGQWLTDHDGAARLDPWYLLAGIAVLALASQLSAWQPARRAAAIPPSVATRTA